MKVANPANYPVASFQPAGALAAAPQPQEAAPDRVFVGRAVGRFNDPVANFFRAGMLRGGGAALAAHGFMGTAGGTLAGGVGGAIAGYHIGRAIENRSTSESSKLAHNATAAGMLIGGGIVMVLAFSGSPLLAGGAMALAAFGGVAVANR